MSDDGNKQLRCAIVLQAWDDYFAPKPTNKECVSAWGYNKREARLFLTKRGGDWARSRRDVCAGAGIDPDALRDRAMQKDARLMAA